MSKPPSIAELLADAKRRLAATPFEPSPREAALLLGHVLSLSEAQILTRYQVQPVAAETESFETLLTRRLQGEPVAYLLGEREFYGRPFVVDRRVLIPRPETEHLVEAALALDLPHRPRILDLCTGSGCVAITLALELSEARVTATDRSPEALAVATLNARRLEATGVRLVAADLVEALDPSELDLVLSNPPYIDPQDAGKLSPEIRGYEPPEALFAEDGGTAMIARLLRDLAALRPGTPLLVEIGQGQAAALERLASSSPFSLREVRPDYAGIPRIASLRRT